MSSIHITDIEAAINYWRERTPSTDGITLSKELRALAKVYALMVYFKEEEVAVTGFTQTAYQAWLTWYESTPDTPCIAICSTSQGDPMCKGCGRTFEEVQRWTELSAPDKRTIWKRITQEGSAWRFNRYAERATESKVNKKEIP